MKKSIFAVAIFGLVSIATANAQKGAYVGAQGASLLSVTFNGDDASRPGSDYKAKTSYTAGITAGYNFNDHFGAAIEGLYSVERQRYTDNLSSYTQKFQYAKVPVLFTYNTNPNSLVMFTAKAGPQLGVLLKSSVTDVKGIRPETDQYRKMHLGAVLGAGASLRVADQLRVNAGLRFDGSITNLEKESFRQAHSGRPDTHHINMGVEVGVRYSL